MHKLFLYVDILANSKSYLSLLILYECYLIIWLIRSKIQKYPYLYKRAAKCGMLFFFFKHLIIRFKRNFYWQINICISLKLCMIKK